MWFDEILLLIWKSLFSVPSKNFDLGSSVSSVSDPELSGMSDKEPIDKDARQKPDQHRDESDSEGELKKKIELSNFRVPSSYSHSYETRRKTSPLMKPARSSNFKTRSLARL